MPSRDSQFLPQLSKNLPFVQGEVGARRRSAPGGVQRRYTQPIPTRLITVHGTGCSTSCSSLQKGEEPGERSPASPLSASFFVRSPHSDYSFINALATRRLPPRGSRMVRAALRCALARAGARMACYRRRQTKPPASMSCYARRPAAARRSPLSCGRSTASCSTRRSDQLRDEVSVALCLAAEGARQRHSPEPRRAAPRRERRRRRIGSRSFAHPRRPSHRRHVRERAHCDAPAAAAYSRHDARVAVHPADLAEVSREACRCPPRDRR